MKNFCFLLLLLLCGNSLAASVSIPLPGNDLTLKPASDLVYKGKRIDAYEASELQDKGLDLSQLDPYESTLWQNIKHPLNELKIENQHFLPSDFKSSPTEIFRSYLIGKKDQKRYVLTASIDNHENIVRAALLRKLGFDIELPTYYPKVTIEFSTKKDKDEFIEKLGEKTLTKRDKWVDAASTDTTLIVKDVLLENAELKNVSIYLPLMVKSRQEQRRIFRALLSVYAITNFNQTLNSTDWKVGRIFNNFLSFTLPYADQFRNVTFEDLVWIQKRINKLTRTDFTEIYNLTHYPDGVKELALEKFISRINSLNQHLKFKSLLAVNRKLSNQFVKDGVLITLPTQDRVREYLRDNAESPYNYRDLFKLFKSQTTYSFLSQILSEAVEKFVPGIRVNDAATNIAEQIADYRAENSISQGDGLPIKLFAYPTANVSAYAARNVVFGQQFGRLAPIQLVDTVSASANLGVFTMLTGIAQDITPAISAQANLVRNYTHVRAMPDLETATSQSLKKVLVPRLMKKLSAIISNEVICSLQGEVNVVESTVNEHPIIYIKYDKNIEGARDKAIAKRAELIQNGADEDIILLVPIDIEEECLTEIDQSREKSLEDFLKELAINETFMISDSLQLINAASATIPIDNVGGVALSASIAGDVAKGLMRVVSFRKEDKEIEISVQTQNNLNKSLSIGLNYFIEILKGTVKWLDGEQKSLIYKIPYENLTPDEKEKTLKALYHMLAHNSLVLVEEHFSPITIYNQIDGRLRTTEFLWYKNEHMLLDNAVQIELPAKKYPNLSREDRTKKLFSTSSMRRNGQNIFGFLNKILNKFSRFLSIGQNVNDPGQAIKGNSKLRYYVSEADVTNKDQKPIVTTKIDYIWKGWSASPKKLHAIFNFIESLFEESQMDYTIDRNRFNDAGDLMGYEVKTTFIVYPEFMQEFENRIITSPKNYAVAFLRLLYGADKWDSYCQRRSQTSPRRTVRRISDCIPSAAKKLLQLREEKIALVSDKKVKEQNRIITLLLEGFDRKKVLAWISSENLFSSTRVTGFKENSEKGYVDYISNTYGTYNREHGTGVFDQIANLLGISSYDLRALNYTPGL